MKVQIRCILLLAALALFLPAYPAQAAPAQSLGTTYQSAPVLVADSSAAPEIKSIKLMNGRDSFYRGNNVRVVMKGSPGGTATFDIVGLANAIPMAEVKPGRYEGSLLVPADLKIDKADLIGHLMLNGQSVSLTSPEPLVLYLGEGWTFTPYNDTSYEF
jgi:hypothetical protein